MGRHTLLPTSMGPGHTEPCPSPVDGEHSAGMQGSQLTSTAAILAAACCALPWDYSSKHTHCIGRSLGSPVTSLIPALAQAVVGAFSRGSSRFSGGELVSAAGSVSLTGMTRHRGLQSERASQPQFPSVVSAAPG